MFGATMAQMFRAAQQRRRVAQQMATARRATQRSAFFPTRAPTAVTSMKKLFVTRRPVPPAVSPKGAAPPIEATTFPTMPPPPVLIAQPSPAGATTIATPAVEQVAQEMAIPEPTPAGFKNALAVAAIVGAILVFGKAGRGRRNW